MIVNISPIKKWTIENTCDALWSEKKEKKVWFRQVMKEGVVLEEVKRPARKTVNAYHTALLSIPELAGRVINPEAVKPGPKAGLT